MKTFIMMWNPAISSFKMEEFEGMLSAEYIDLNWSVWDYNEIEGSDRFFLVRVGEGATGIVMSGYVWGEAWEGEDWSGKGRKTFYVDLDVETMLNSEKVPYISTEQLMKELPGFDWTGGHSGRLLPQDLSTKLELLWADYVFANHDVFDNVNAQSHEFVNQTELTSEIMKQYLLEMRGNACEICGYDYKKVWGGDCDKFNSYHAFFLNKGMKSNSMQFLSHVHCICDSCNRLSTDKLRERLGEPEWKEQKEISVVEDEEFEFLKVEDLIENDYRGPFVFFWGHTEEPGKITHACLSQWYPSVFTEDDVTYSCMEQFMMAEKARIMGDEETRLKILASSVPEKIKALGRQVKNWDEEKWNQNKFDVVVKGNLLKFGQNPQLLDYLLSTDVSVLVEASPYDKIWGIGLSANDTDSKNPRKWNGTNLLGFALMKVRQILKNVDKQLNS